MATPTMQDLRFSRTVLLVCAYSAEGAMGVIFNKPLPDLDLSALLAHLEIEQPDHVEGASVANSALHALVHFGGPVEPGRGFVLHTPDYFNTEGSLRITNQLVLSTTLDVLSEIAQGQGPAKYLTALGYAGWSPGQLDAEIQAGGWLIAASDPALVFETSAADKWEKSLARIGVDPSMLSSTPGRA